MDVSLFVQNIKNLCKAKGIKPTVACEQSGAGKNFLNHIETRGSKPSVEKVQMLAEYLGVTTSKNHGSNCILALRHLGGDPDTIIQSAQEALDNGLYSDPMTTMYFSGMAPEEIAAQDAYNKIRAEVLSGWLRSIPRDQMLATLTSMLKIPEGCSMEYLPGESMGPTLLMEEWNKANPQERPICYNPNLLP